MLGFISARNDATSASVSERFMCAAIFLSCSGVGRETGIGFSPYIARRGAPLLGGGSAPLRTSPQESRRGPDGPLRASPWKRIAPAEPALERRRVHAGREWQLFFDLIPDASSYTGWAAELLGTGALAVAPSA